jgi:ABC-2 type transport system ATP-binding protein
LTAIIRAKDLSKWYGQVLGLNDVTVEVGRGITGLIGPNGAGKSTLLWLLTGQLRPSRGSVTVWGESPWGNPKLFHRIGFCPETEGTWRHLTGLGFVTALARLAGMRRREAKQRAAEALARVGMRPFMSRRLGTYSKGMRQRTKFAQALVHDPELLVLDEPLAGLDPVGRRELLDLMRALAEEGRSVLLASHVLHEVESVTSRILLINRGRILAEGDVHEVRALIDRHPHHVRIVCDRPRDLAAGLLAAADVVSVHVDDAAGAVVVETRRPDDFYARLTARLVDGKFDVRSIESEDDNMAAVFRYLTE